MKKSLVSVVAVFSMLLMMFVGTFGASADVVSTAVEIPESVSNPLGSSVPLWEKTATGVKVAPSASNGMALISLGVLDLTQQTYLHIDFKGTPYGGFLYWIYIFSPGGGVVDTLCNGTYATGDVVLDMTALSAAKAGGAYNTGWEFYLTFQPDNFGGANVGWDYVTEVEHLYLSNSETAEPPVAEQEDPTIQKIPFEIPETPTDIMGAVPLWEKTETGFKIAPNSGYTAVLFTLPEINLNETQTYLDIKFNGAVYGGFSYFVYVYNADGSGPIDTLFGPQQAMDGDVHFDLTAASAAKAGGAYGTGFKLKLAIVADPYGAYFGWDYATEVTDMYLTVPAEQEPEVPEDPEDPEDPTVEKIPFEIPETPTDYMGAAPLWEKTETGFKIATASSQSIVLFTLPAINLNETQTYLNIKFNGAVYGGFSYYMYVYNADGSGPIDVLFAGMSATGGDVHFDLTAASAAKAGGAYGDGYMLKLAISADPYGAYFGWDFVTEVTDMYLTVPAEEEPALSADGVMGTLGSKIRTGEAYAQEGQQALCFGTQINRVVRDNVAYVTIADKEFELKSFGTLVMVTSKISDINELVVGEAMPAAAIDIKGVNVWESTDEYLVYTGVLINIGAEHFDTDITARSYMVVSDGAQDYVVYGEAISRSVNYTLANAA